MLYLFPNCGRTIADKTSPNMHQLAVILVLVVGTIRLVGSNANNVFSSAGSAVQ